jgi:tRNA pseudouridine55 synthase
VTDGVLVVDKPAGPTSFDVVDRVRRMLGAAKAGHTGTLDPAATGVLAVCLDEAVKLQQWLTDGDKGYEATVLFGASTDTEDAEGRVTAEGDPSGLDAARVAGALPRLTGEIEQVPPMYSAVRVGGRRLHQAARAGEEVERAPRRVVVHSLELLSWEPPQGGRARARLSVRCGKGTYVRTLAASLGGLVGVPAHLEALRRTASGPFTLAGALPLAEAEALARTDLAALRARILPPAEALAFLPAVQVDGAEAEALAHGRALARRAPAPLCRALDAAGRLLAVCAPDATGERLAPVRVLAPARGPGPGRAGGDRRRR